MRTTGPVDTPAPLRLLTDRGRVYALTPRGAFVFSPERESWGTALALRRAASTAPKRMVINVVLTLECNYRCVYCWQRDIRQDWEEHPDHQLAMVREAMRQTLSSGKRVHLHFTGGEPLLRKPQLRRLVNDASALTEPAGVGPPSFSLTTNGSLLDAEFAEYCAERSIGVCISLDGPFQGTPARRTASGEPGLARTQSALSECVDYLAGRFSLRATLHHGSPAPSRVYAYLAEFRPANVSLGFCLSDAPEEPLLGPVDMDAIVSDWSSLCSGYLGRLRAGHRHTLQPVLSYLMNLGQSQGFVRCGARAGRELAIMPDGTTLPCENLAVHPEVSPDCASRADTPAACLACWAQSFCGGPCLVDGTPSTTLCAFTRSIIEETFRWAMSLQADELGLLGDPDSGTYLELDPVNQG